MSNYLKQFEDYLAETGGRLSTQKKAIAEEIRKTRTHFEVESFIDKIRAKNQKFSRATVYRVIKQLLDAGLIQKISTMDGKVYYERSSAHQQHDHLICNQCGRILEIKDDALETQLLALCKALNFQPEYRSLHMYGKCSKCQPTGEN